MTARVLLFVAIVGPGCRHRERSGAFTDVVELGLGGFHSCARTRAGAVWCWGMNHRGQVGRSPHESVQREPARVEGLTNVRQLALGDDHTCALHDDGTVSCWGGNAEGQLGDGTTVERPRPARVSGLRGVVEVSAGAQRTCARLRDGTVRCFGNLGLGQRDRALTPRPIAELVGAAQLAIGGDHDCALFSDGTVRCRGINLRGQVGDGTTEDRPAFTPVAGLTGAVQVAVGEASSCARMADGTVRCWGYNGLGCLGVDRSDEAVTTPTTVVGLANVAQLVLGEFHRCVRRNDGTVACWGDRFWSQIGDGRRGIGAERVVPRPVHVAALAGVQQLALGRRHTCALRGDRAVLCWGENNAGQLGDGTIDERATPTPMR